MEIVNTNTGPRMMTVRQVAKTGILPEHAIRRGIKEGWVPFVPVGKKNLVNFDKLVKFLEDC